MTSASHVPMNEFQEFSLEEKAKAITMFGKMIATRTAFGIDFFLYALDNYYVEAASIPETGAVVYIRATKSSHLADLYLEAMHLPKF